MHLVKCNGINPTFIFSTSKYIRRIINFPIDNRCKWTLSLFTLGGNEQGKGRIFLLKLHPRSELFSIISGFLSQSQGYFLCLFLFFPPFWISNKITETRIMLKKKKLKDIFKSPRWRNCLRESRVRRPGFFLQCVLFRIFKKAISYSCVLVTTPFSP